MRACPDKRMRTLPEFTAQPRALRPFAQQVGTPAICSILGMHAQNACMPPCLRCMMSCTSMTKARTSLPPERLHAPLGPVALTTAQEIDVHRTGDRPPPPRPTSPHHVPYTRKVRVHVGQPIPGWLG